MRTIRLGVLILVSSIYGFFASGCAGNGEGLDANGRPIGSEPPPTDDFSRIQDTIFTPICTSCHAGASAPLGLRLDEGASFAMLVNVASSEVPALLRVSPGDPDNSYLVHKIEGRAAVGGRMPLGGPPLPQESIDLVKQWIAGGALAPVAAPDESSTLQVVETLPRLGEKALPTTRVTIVFNQAIDGSLASPELVTLLSSGGDSSFIEGNEEIVPTQEMLVATKSPTTLTLKLPQPLLPDAYELRLRGSGSLALAGIDGHVLDGDANGIAGGDYRTTFDVVDASAGVGEKQ